MNIVELLCSTQGRVGRALYWSCFGIWFLIDVLLRGTVSAVASWTGNEVTVAIAFWAWIGFSIVTYFPMTALLVKRLHDTGRSGYWTIFQHGMLLSGLLALSSLARMAAGSAIGWGLAFLLCALGGFVVFIFTLLSSDGMNEYGLSA
jgi:uncharacterized membrane protein YhaH (DUF805 family)